MELYQVRYFLALASTLNFTRAAEMCCVSQPALTRAIQALEYEMRGALITRERRLSHLTELGQRLHPFFEQAYKAALTAKALARACSDGAALRLAVTASVDLGRVVVPLGDVIARFPNVEIDVLRGSAEEVLEFLKCGDADVAIADADLGSWERLDSWLIDRIPYSLVANRLHEFATRQPLPISEIAKARLICLPHCRLAREILDLTSSGETKVCQASSLGDIFTLLKLNAGVALLPRDLDLPDGLVRVETTGYRLENSIHLFAVAGRLRAKSAGAFVEHFSRKTARQHVCDTTVNPPVRRAGRKSIAEKSRLMRIPVAAHPSGMPLASNKLVRTSLG